MILAEQKNIEGIIIEILSNGPLKTTDLIGQIRNRRQGATKQAVYSALRKLRKEEVVVMHKKEALLNQVWIKKLRDFIKNTDENYVYTHKEGGYIEGVSQLSEGDRIIYHFNDYTSLDIYWSHIFSIIIKKIGSKVPIFFYNPHEWFLLVRNEAEKKTYEWLNKENRLTFLTLGHDTLLDKLIVKEYSTDVVSVAMDTKTGFPENYYVAVIDDYVIETKFDMHMTDAINAVYQKTQSLDEKVIQSIQEITSKKYKAKVIVSRNKKKAQKIKKKLAKNFFIPKEARGL